MRSEPEIFLRPNARKENGFVLLIILWWLALLMFLATQIAGATRTAVSISGNIRRSAVAEAQADAAVNHAIFQILARSWRADGGIHIVQGRQAVAEVRIEDEGERIDPNVAPALLMQALLRECGASPQAAADLATAIGDWRSVDLPRTAGPSRNLPYRTAGRNYLPPNARFVSLDELGLVSGMTPRLLDCLEPHLSVYSLAVPSARTAMDPLVRRALAEAYPYDTAQFTGGMETEVSVVRITALARQGHEGGFRRIAVVSVARADPDDGRMFRILAWEDSPD